MSDLFSPSISLRNRHRRVASLMSAAAVTVLLGWQLLPPDGLLCLIGLMISLQLGVVAYPRRSAPPRIVLPPELDLPFQLARDELVYRHYRRTTELLLRISRQPDPVFRQLTLDQLDDWGRRLTTIAAGTLVFNETETWRIAYEQLLRSTGLYLYRSVAQVNCPDYWQDEPGRKSMQLNYELQAKQQLNIERIAIIADELWLPTQTWPMEPIRSWLHEQFVRDIDIKFVRASALKQEPELAADIGIYGSRALGTQELDHEGRTARFVLTFDFTKLLEAEARWNRLLIYAESYANYLDRIARLR